MATLQDAYSELREAPFPEFPEDDALADWLADLGEMDGHVAGLAQSALAGARVYGAGLMHEMDEMGRKLDAVAPTAGPDVELVPSYRQYVALLRRVVNCLAG